tara:strand:- start:6667 stop:7146 length:480 start_codon:yes stop_codon:yes gene_type:complete
MSVNVSGVIVLDSEGKEVDLGEFKEKVLLIVNVASYCGNTDQYLDLQRLHKKYFNRGLRVLGFPCNDFGAQEPGTINEIMEFCSTKYGVNFEIFGKVKAKEPTTEPYTTLNKADPSGDVEWNFEKFLVNRQGDVMGRFKPSEQPLSENIISAIEGCLDS